MMMKQNSSTTTVTTAAIVCGNCGVEERRLLHHVRHRGIFRRLCTSCVLRLHSQSFCPTCFLVYDHPPPSSNDAVTCFKCYSSSHSRCVGSNASSPYVCPPCLNPNLPIFSLNKAKDRDRQTQNNSFRAIDNNAAKVLLAAATIAVVSMNKAAVAARAEAERRAKEAAFTRKRAREALEHLACLMAKEKLKQKEVSGSGNVGVLEKNRIGGNANSTVVAVTEQNRIGNQLGVDRVDSSIEVLAALNAVKLKEKDRVQGSKVQNAVSGAPSYGMAMDVEVSDRLGVSSVSNIGAPFVHNHVTENENEKSGDLGHLDNYNAKGEKVSNGLLAVPPLGRPQCLPNNHASEENIGSQQ